MSRAEIRKALNKWRENIHSKLDGIKLKAGSQQSNNKCSSRGKLIQIYEKQSDEYIRPYFTYERLDSRWEWHRVVHAECFETEESLHTQAWK